MLSNYNRSVMVEKTSSLFRVGAGDEKTIEQVEDNDFRMRGPQTRTNSCGLLVQKSFSFQLTSSAEQLSHSKHPKVKQQRAPKDIDYVSSVVKSKHACNKVSANDVESSSCVTARIEDVRRIKKLRRSAPFAIQKRPRSSIDYLESIIQSPISWHRSTTDVNHTHLVESSLPQQHFHFSQLHGINQNNGSAWSLFSGSNNNNRELSSCEDEESASEEHSDQSASVERYTEELSSFVLDFNTSCHDANAATASHFTDFDDDENIAANITQNNTGAGNEMTTSTTLYANQSFLHTMRHPVYVPLSPPATEKKTTVNREEVFKRNTYSRASYPPSKGSTKNLVLNRTPHTNIRTRVSPFSKSKDKSSDYNQKGSNSDCNSYRLCLAIWDHITCEPDELQFNCGDMIEILDSSDRNWWMGRIIVDVDHSSEKDGQERAQEQGWFPNIFVQEVSELESNATAAADEEGDEAAMVPKKKNTIRTLHRRSLCVKELLYSERNYVKLLKNVIDIYQGALKRSRCVKLQQVRAIFSNISEIYSLHESLLDKLENCAVDEVRRETRFHEWRVSTVFIGSIKHFVQVYSVYCNNYQSAIEALRKLETKKSVANVLEKCRKKHGEILSLQHFLLTPIQKICRYQMQLAELIKYTTPDHPDFKSLKFATEEMRRAAFEINEKRRFYENKLTESSNVVGEDSNLFGKQLSKRPTKLKILKSLPRDLQDRKDSPSQDSFEDKPVVDEPNIKRIPSKNGAKRLLKFLGSQPSI